MYCAKCGKQLNDGDAFCVDCGTAILSSAIDADSALNPEPTPTLNTLPASSNTSSNSSTSNSNHTTVLVYGIIACAFSLTFYLSFVGIIMGKLGLNKYEEYINVNASFSRQADIGRILSKVGFIVGIVLTIIAVITTLILIA